jgi:hypothetical protein
VVGGWLFVVAGNEVGVIRTTVAILLVVFITTEVFGQNMSVGSCPSVAIRGPAGITLPGEIANFSAEITGPIPSDVKYSWSVTAGTVVSGQGTLLLQVRTPKTGEYTMTVSLRISGLPQSCPNTFSETGGVTVYPATELIDAYGPVSTRAEILRLKKAVERLRKSPGSLLYLIIYPSISSRSADRRIYRLKKSLKKLGLVEDFTVVVGPNSAQSETRVYIVPIGADNPVP